MSANPNSVIEVPQGSFSRREDRDVPAVIPQTPTSMLALALARGMDKETIAGLMDLKDRWEENEARKAFAEAIAAFKLDPPKVIKDKTNNQYESKYASIGNLVNTVNAALGQHGLSARWDVDQSAGIKVSCILTHRGGHSERVSMSGPPDDSGKKNPLQQIKSTVTYLKIATFEAVTGIAASDAGDDDGNGARGLTKEDIAGWKAQIEATTTKDKAKEVWRESVKVCEAVGDVGAAERLKAILKAHGEFIDTAAKAK